MNPPQPAPFNPHHGFQDLYEKYFEEASFLWMRRSLAVKQSHNNQEDIAEFEQRIQAHLNGLMTSPELGWSVCESALASAAPGEVFTAAVTAFTTGDVKKIKQVVDAGLRNDKTFNGLVSALGWLAPDLVTPWLDRFLLSNELDHKHLGVAACSVRRHDAGDYLSHILSRDDCLQHKKLHARALRLIGELRRQDLMPALIRAMSADDPDIAFWANWSAILLGDKSAVSKIERYLLNGGPHQQRALQITFRVLPVDQARQRIAVMAQNEKLGRAVIQATAALGDPHAVNWLIQKMAEPATAKISGEAFTLITGIDLKQNGLINAHPPAFESGPNDDPQDENVAMDEDDNLPWPDAVKVAQLWQQQGRNFIVGQRYFMGQAITAPWLLKQLQHAKQRQRDAAALELALSDPTQHFYNAQGSSAGAERSSPASPLHAGQSGNSSDAPKIYIAGMGMITPAGANVAMTAATVKAGVSCYTESEYYGQNAEPITMASVPDIIFSEFYAYSDEGSRQSERYDRVRIMAALALREACAHHRMEHPIPLVLAMPESTGDDEVLSPLIESLEHNYKHWVSAAQYHSIYSGRAAGMEAINFAFRYLYELQNDFVLIGGSDSYKDSARLNPLIAADRLLTQDSPDSFAPGEAACFLLLTRHPEQAMVRNGHIIALSPPGIADEPGHLGSDEPYRGEGLDQAFKKALVDHPQPDIHSIYSSMNGENHWAKEYGVAFVRNKKAFQDKVRIEHPAEIFGDLGAATAPVLIALAAESLFNNATEKTHLVYSSSDTAKRGAIVVQKSDASTAVFRPS